MERVTYFVAALVATVVAGGCETSSTLTVSPNPVKCQVSVAAPASMVEAGGATMTLAVTTQPECAWDATTTVNWISGLSPATGQGTGNLEFRVAPNEGASSREGAIVVNGDQVRVAQRAPCRFELTPASQSVSASGGVGSVTVAAASDCAWTATTDVSWISLTPPLTGNGNGTVGAAVAPNGGDQRSGSVIVGGQRSVVTQTAAVAPPCDYRLAPTSQNIAATGGAGTVTVSVQSGCAWAASSTVMWMTVTAGATGTGNGSVGFSVVANTGASRTGTLAIAGHAFTVTQTASGAPPTPPPPAPSCTYSISPRSRNENANAQTDTVTVSAGSGCTWTAVSNASWITVTSGSTGTGNGSVGYGLQANIGAARTGTMTIAGETFTVTQAAAPPCSYSISPPKQKVGAAPQTGTVTVSTGSHCTWTAVSNASWITVTSGASGTGDGTVTFSVGQNSGGKRKGTLTVAGRTAEVEQEDK